jgi:hypothetical protein
MATTKTLIKEFTISSAMGHPLAGLPCELYQVEYTDANAELELNPKNQFRCYLVSLVYTGFLQHQLKIQERTPDNTLQNITLIANAAERGEIFPLDLVNPRILAVCPPLSQMIFSASDNINRLQLALVKEQG